MKFEWTNDLTCKLHGSKVSHTIWQHLCVALWFYDTCCLRIYLYHLSLPSCDIHSHTKFTMLRLPSECQQPITSEHSGVKEESSSGENKTEVQWQLCRESSDLRSLHSPLWQRRVTRTRSRDHRGRLISLSESWSYHVQSVLCPALSI